MKQKTWGDVRRYFSQYATGPKLQNIGPPLSKEQVARLRKAFLALWPDLSGWEDSGP
jgi:hypothetical protein